MAKVPQEKPPQVLAAKRRRDKKALSVMGKAGNRVAALNRLLEKLRQQELLSDAQAQAERNRIGWDDDYRL